jgi:hypothetical protein
MSGRHKWAVVLKEATGLAYSTALKIALGEVAYRARSPDCLLKSAIGGVPGARQPGEDDPFCRCAECKS